jgi:hypothetical protein
MSVADLHHFDADPDSTYHPDEDPDSDFHLMGMQIRMRIRSHNTADTDSNFVHGPAIVLVSVLVPWNSSVLLCSNF